MVAVVTDTGLAEIANVMTGSGTPPSHVGAGTGTTAALVTDTTLETEVSTRGATVDTRTTTSTTNDTSQHVGTVSFSSSLAITEAGLFNASSSGTMFVRDVFAAINVGNGDSIQFTFQVQNEQG